MSADRHQRIREIFLRACALPKTERDAFLAEACGGDEDLLQDVRSLIEHDPGDEEVREPPRVHGPGVERVRDPTLARDRPASEPTSDAEGASPFGWHAGDRVGPFRLIRQLGRGGMGVVWEAEQLELKRRVALKLLPPSMGASTTTLRRFQREAEAGGRLQHPAIVQVYSVGVVDDVSYLEQELVADGRTLADELDEQRHLRDLPASHFRDVAERFAMIAAALRVAHDAGVVHRDLKPGNILLTAAGQPKVADFGLAQLNTDLVLTRTGELAGTPFYMSPEQAMSKRIGIDHRTDIFSLGATLYECLTLRKPFEGDTSQQVLEQIVMVDPPDPRKLRSRVPRDLAVICMKMIEKQRDHRFQSMQELAADLGRFLRDEPIIAKPPGAPTRVLKWARRHKAISASSMVGAVAAVIIVGLLFRALAAEKHARNEVAEKESALMQRGIALEQAESSKVAAKTAEAEARSLAAQKSALANEREAALVRAREAESQATAAASEARRRLYVMNVAQAALNQEGGHAALARQQLADCPSEYRHWEWRHVSLEQGPIRTQDLGDRILSLAVAREVPRVAVKTGRKEAQVYDLLTGEMLFETKSTHQVIPASVAISANGSRLASSSSGSVWDVDAGIEVATLAGVFEDITLITLIDISPNGRLVAGTDSTSPQLHIWDGATGRLLHTIGGYGHGVNHLAFDVDGERLAACSEDGQVFLWSTASGSLLMTLSMAPGATPTAVAFGVDGEHFATRSSDDTVTLFKAGTGERLQTYTDFVGRSILGGSTLGLSPDSRRLAAVSGRTLNIWDVASGALQVAVTSHEDDIRAIAFSGDGGLLVTGGDDGVLNVWDAATRGGVNVLQPYSFRDRQFSQQSRPAAINRLAMDAGGDKLASITNTGLVNVWDLASGDCLLTETLGRCVAFDVLGRLLVGRHDGTVDLLVPDSGKRVATWKLHDGPVSAMTVAWDGQVIVTAGKDGFVHATDANTGEILNSIEVGMEAWSIACDESGTHIAIASDDGPPGHQGPNWQDVTVWEAATGHLLHTLAGHDDEVFSVAVSPDGRFVASGGEDKTIHVWDLISGVQIAVLTANEDEVNAVAFSADSQRLLSASKDATVRVWDTVTWDLLITLQGNGKELDAVAMTSDGLRILAGGKGARIHTWEADLDKARTLWHAEDVRVHVRPLVDRMFQELLLPRDVESALQTNPSLDDLERQTALRLARMRGPTWVDELLLTAWEIARRADATSEEYSDALRRARSAEAIAPETPVGLYTTWGSGGVGTTVRLTILGAAEYRDGELDSAIDTLTRARQLNGTPSAGAPLIAHLDEIFLALCHARMGHAEQAKALFEPLRALAKLHKPWGDELTLYTELEGLIGKS